MPPSSAPGKPSDHHHGDRPYDLVVLGATGFTGRLVAQHLADRLAAGGPDAPPTRWAVAGRRAEVLHPLAADLGADVEVEVVDVHDLLGLLELARRTRVLVTTVGPYARHGELVVQACVRARTHYADITGEPSYVDLVRARYGPEARREGLKVVTSCGFDSVPHDLGAGFTAAQLPQDADLEVRGYVRAQGRVSGGTAASALAAITAPEATGPRRAPGSEAEPPARREVRAVPARLHRVPRLDAYGVPLPTIDASIVRRSARVLDGYGASFAYGHFARVGRLPTVAAGIAGVGLAAAMARTGPTRRLLERALPSPGDGPDEDTRARSRFEVTFVGRGGGEQVVARVAGGDPGYTETARWLGEAALSLAHDDGPQEAGVLTPAVGLGAPYTARLRALGLTMEVVDEGGSARAGR